MQPRQRQTRFIRKMIYTLKRELGFEITLHKITEEVLDLETGDRTPTIITKKIKRAIILPATLRRTAEYGDSPKNFKYGALYDTGSRQITIDAVDLGDFIIEEEDYIIWNGKRWQVSVIQTLELSTAYTITVKMVEGTLRHMVEEVAIESQLVFTQEVEDE